MKKPLNSHNRNGKTDVYIFRHRSPQKSQFYLCIADHFEEFVKEYDEQFEREYGFWRPGIIWAPIFIHTSMHWLQWGLSMPMAFFILCLGSIYKRWYYYTEEVFYYAYPRGKDLLRSGCENSQHNGSIHASIFIMKVRFVPMMRKAGSSGSIYH